MDKHKLWLWDPIAPLSRRGDLPLHHGMLQRLLQWFFYPPDSAPPATLLIRLMAGGVFLWEGVMKFVFPHTLGVGRFLKLGIPAPEFMAPFVGVMEIVGGTLFVLGLCTRLAALPLLIDILINRAYRANLTAPTPPARLSRLGTTFAQMLAAVLAIADTRSHLQPRSFRASEGVLLRRIQHRRSRMSRF